MIHKVAILQPIVPHYREEFFNKLMDEFDLDVYCYDSVEELNNKNFKQGKTNVLRMPSIILGRFLLYNPLILFKNKYDVLILMLHFGHITTWLLLLTKFIHRKKIIVWGHGISIKRFLKEERKPNLLLKWMIKLSDGCWFYTANELSLWKKLVPESKAVSLNNTLTGVDNILTRNVFDKDELKLKYGIKQETILIYCARFNQSGRRIDLLERIIKECDSEKFGFIIIGDGELKPDFSKYSHVYDFGSIYDNNKKYELFCIADIYFQPGWVGLSIVEAMAYGKPIFTFKRSSEILQCVEYSYIQNGSNGIIFDNCENCLEIIQKIDQKEIRQMGENARKFVSENLRMEIMINSAAGSISAL